MVVDGTDRAGRLQAVKDAAERARSGEGPTLVEAKVYRFQPHTSDDDDRTLPRSGRGQGLARAGSVRSVRARLRDLGVLRR